MASRDFVGIETLRGVSSVPQPDAGSGQGLKHIHQIAQLLGHQIGIFPSTMYSNPHQVNGYPIKERGMNSGGAARFWTRVFMSPESCLNFK